MRSVTPPSDLPASVREDGMPGNPAQRARAKHPARTARRRRAGCRSANASNPLRQAKRAGVKDRSRRAVTAMTARGAAREPGGAERRHARNRTCRSPQPTSQDEAALVRIPCRLNDQIHQARLEVALAMKGLAAVLDPCAQSALDPAVGHGIGGVEAVVPLGLDI